MATIPGLGIVTLAIGARRYIRQAQILSLSLRRNMPEVPIAIVTDSDELASYADCVITVDRSLPISTAQKLLLYKYSPFEETLFIDSDCVATRPFHTELERIRKYAFSPVIERLTPIDGSDEYVDDLRWTLNRVGGTAFPKFNGGLYFFSKTQQARDVFKLAQEYFWNHKSYRIRPFDRGGAGDETVIALALAHFGQLELHDDAGRLMRTPTGLKGRITIDPLGGGCSFEGVEGVVRPAICHFAGQYLLMPEYFLAGISLRSNTATKDLSLWQHLRANVSSFVAKLSRFLHYRVDGAKKRFNRLLRC
jgi:hypothetical protein